VDRFERTELLLGKKKAASLRSSRVVIVGLGSVGSYAVSALARAGIENLLLVDFDTIRSSNINRHPWAFDSTLGRTKADVGCAIVRDINPNVHVNGLELFVDKQQMENIIDTFKPDLVIDAIDSLTPKAQVLTACARKSVPVISSMGASLRTDPAMIRFGPILKTTHCPLAFRLRKLLRRQGVEHGIWCVYSQQQHTRGKGVIPSEHVLEEQYSRGRIRATLGSLPTITGIFGLTLAHYAIDMLCGGIVQPAAG
jgi:tRNA A37 threonylcarbamoyladenosine dehydratase